MILLHICCGPCTLYPLKILREKDFKVMGLFFNPNIHPYREFKARLKAVEEMALKKDLEVIYHREYGLREFLKEVIGREEFPKRCEACYFLRLRETARLAAELKAEAFTTTILYSPYLLHHLVKEIGEALSKVYQIPFYYDDFRKGFKKGQDEAVKLGLYRQSYCGCIFSEEERYYKKRRKEIARKRRELPW